MIEKGNSVSIPVSGIETFDVRLKELIGNTSLRNFGEMVSISEGGLRKYLQPDGSKPTFDKVVNIAAACGVNLQWLCTGEGAKYPGKEIAIEKVASVSDVETATYRVDDFLEEYALIDGYHTQVSAGHGAIWDNEQVRRKLAFRAKWLRYRGLKPENLRVVFAKGDSMEPTIHSGDSILVDITATSLSDGSIFVVRIGDELFAKRVQLHIEGGVTIISDNKEYKDQMIHPAFLDKLAVVGKVVWIGKDVK